ncbi:MAG: hypothetical protein ACP5VE_08595 [Chthonomonadales bacterium]
MDIPGPIHTAVIWLSACATLAVFSFLYRENRAYRFAEHILLGLGVGFGVATTVTDILLPKWYAPLAAAVTQRHWGAAATGILAGLLGAFWYGMYHPRTVWLSRLVMGITIGAGAGLAFKAQINDKLPQVIASFKSPYVPPGQAAGYNTTADNIVFIVVLACVLAYFFFSFQHRNRVLRTGARWGRFFLMVTFGVFFGNTVMTRMSVFIERVWFLLTQWLHLVH